ncbi:hypothetical protein [Pseudanabaena sp. FACHB-2040]|uniref:GspE/PulE/PilB domain-containing protein n=1 Tax=Pseudanabaena sp. FACHB-2040 TaxID=2692859 RepID=UPI001685911E|nr:hypothetical protein [Pseudanabaena sp. FACHB-2040]MBD2260437.1 hypothetical protein [Pseudanabaena sp. FACHB-2040]
MSQPPKDSSAAHSASHETPRESLLVEDRVNADEMFTLIDGILPFEACLYYQVLPLSIEGSRLNLGMVNPSDYAAADYVRRQTSYINYSVVTLQISSDWHRDSLSRYLSHSAKVKQLRHRAASTEESATRLNHHEANAENPINYQATLVVDTPDELEREFSAAESLALRAAQLPKPLAAAIAKPQPKPPSGIAVSPAAEAGAQDPLELIIQSRYRDLPIEGLRQLSSPALMEALLSRVLEDGIGRLYFENHGHYGRILWSKDGVVQSALDLIKLEVFQGVINEFKRMTHLPLLRFSASKQVEIERLYQGDRVLLRLRVMPNVQGEEATLQVLRGTALRFYQRQQIDNLGRDALGIAQTLQQRLHEIRERARQTLNFTTSRQEALPTIIQMLKQMEAQIQELIRLAENETSQGGPREVSRED